MQEGNRRAVLAALAANLGLAIAKFVGYGATGSASLLAEAVHSVADTGNQTLLLWGAAAASRPESESRPFGHGRERFFWSFVVALVLFALGSLFAMYQGVTKFGHPEALENVAVAVSILVLGIALEGASFRTAVRESRKLKGNASWWSFVRHSRSPELPVVLLEDLGALCGLVIALIGIGLASATGDTRFDAAGSVVIGLLLGCIAALLAVEMKSLLIGEPATPADLERLAGAILGAPDVKRIINMRTEHIGPDRLLIGAKLEFDDALSFRALSDAIDEVEARMRASVPMAQVIYIEPDVWDAAEARGPVTD